MCEDKAERNSEKGDEVLRRLLKTPPDPKGGKRGAEAPRRRSDKEGDQDNQSPKAGR